ncbi:MAG: type I pullulanase, partial [Clostridium sp.]
MIDNNLYYDGALGAIYNKEKTTFVLWAPTADNVYVKLYSRDSLVNMAKGNNGEWSVVVEGDLENEFYNYIVEIDGKENVVVDPYAYAVGVNGTKGMVVDLALTNPDGFENDIKPELKKATDAIIYEMHVRDFTIDDNSEVKDEYKGKFIGLTSKNQIEHLKRLGVTHIHLLPIADYKSIEEESFSSDKYNWGYDPQNYNVPEGSYSTNPYDGKVRIKEFKEMIMAMHKAGIRVIMDVVYNHTYDTETSLFNLAVPKYYHRTDSNGNFTNGSACGNEVASEKPMVRRFMKDSISYWAKEYHIDGFRFDLMGLHDIKTMKEIRKELDKLDKSILVYGEGWKGGESPLPDEESALKCNTTNFELEQIACFSDDIRDAVKGDVFEAKSPGFV